MSAPIRTTTTFHRPFQIAGFNETLPPGDYAIETPTRAPAGPVGPRTRLSAVEMHLHPRDSHPGLSRRLTVPLAALEHAEARDKLSGAALTDFFIEEMLADPMTHLLMKADGIAESDIRNLYASGAGSGQGKDAPGRQSSGATGPHPGSTRPGIGE